MVTEHGAGDREAQTDAARRAAARTLEAIERHEHLLDCSFGGAARVHPRYRTPAVAIIAQAAWSSLLVLSAKADALVDYTGSAIVLFSGVAVVALFVLRGREPQAARPFRTWGYPVTPALYVVVSVLILINGLVSKPLPTGAGVLVMGAGIPIYWWFSWRR